MKFEKTITGILAAILAINIGVGAILIYEAKLQTQKLEWIRQEQIQTQFAITGAAHYYDVD